MPELKTSRLKTVFFNLGVPFFNERYTKGVFLQSEIVKCSFTFKGKFVLIVRSKGPCLLLIAS